MRLFLIWTPYVFLGMVKLRCWLDPTAACGWMSFHGGITWHIVPAAALVALAAGLVAWRGWTWVVMPLAGGWFALLWYTLPVALIHVPPDGICPEIPILCHDRPLLGLGGLAYWLMPFVAWTGMRAFVWTGWARYQIPKSRTACRRRP